MGLAEQKLAEKTKKEFGDWAKYYDGGVFRRFFFERFYRRVIGILTREGEKRFAPGARFLDIACGTGEVVVRLARTYPAMQFTGVDFSKEMVDRAQAKTAALNNVTFAEADALALPFPDQSFDLALCSESFHHFADPDKAVAEVARILKPGGLFFLVDPGYDTLPQKILCKCVFKLFETVKKFYPRRELEKILSNGGLPVRFAQTRAMNNYVLAEKGIIFLHRLNMQRGA